MKYSLRSLFVVVTLVCVVLGVGLAWVKLEQERTRRMSEAGHALSERGVSFGITGNAAPDGALQTWRGDESWYYLNYCAFGPFGPSDTDDTRKTVAESDLAIMSLPQVVFKRPNELLTDKRPTPAKVNQRVTTFHKRPIAARHQLRQIVRLRR